MGYMVYWVAHRFLEVIVTGLSLLNPLSSLKSILPYIFLKILLQFVEFVSFQPIFAASVIIH